MPRYTAINNLLGFGAGASGGGPPTYAFTSTPSSINEGSSGTFTVTTTNVPTGTTLYWTILNSTTNAADFSASSGSFTISGGTGSFSVTATADFSTEGAQTFQAEVRTVSTSGTVVATSTSVTINDTSTTVTVSFANVDAGWPAGIYLIRGIRTVSFTVTTTNFGTGTLYWKVNPVTASTSNFQYSSGNFSVNSNSGTITITSATATDQGSESVTYQVQVYADAGLTVLLGTSATQTLYLRWIVNMGINTNGQLTDGTTVNKTTLASAIPIPRSYNSVTLGQYSSWLSRNDATLWTAGYNIYGCFGDGTASGAGNYRSSPGQIAGTWYFGLGSFGSAAIHYPDAYLYTWGSEGNGVQGDNTNSAATRLTPNLVNSTAWNTLSMDYYYTLFAVNQVGKLFGTGYNVYGNMATGQTPASSYLTLTAISSTTSFKSIATGFFNFYALTNTGRLFSAGLNSSGQLGDGTTLSRSNFVAVLGTGSSYCLVAASQNSAAAVDITGRLFTWGSGVVGMNGGPTTANRSSPVQILSSQNFLDTNGGILYGGLAHYFAKDTTGQWWAWGQNQYGQLLDGTTANRSSPVAISGSWKLIQPQWYSSTGYY
jgi:alpha-tubulin suppressor-like RCC1 family protein